MRKENGGMRREDEEDRGGGAVLRLLAHPVRDGPGLSGAGLSRNRKANHVPIQQRRHQRKCDAPCMRSGQNCSKSRARLAGVGRFRPERATAHRRGPSCGLLAPT
jgi:hypothetical protein